VGSVPGIRNTPDDERPKETLGGGKVLTPDWPNIHEGSERKTEEKDLEKKTLGETGKPKERTASG